jgi:ribosomal protein S18 acetylase RimI-like enzyme
MNEGTWKVDNSPDPADLRFLEDRIHSFNVDLTEIEPAGPLAIFVRADGEIVAGIDGFMWAGVLQVNNLWVREDLRGHGYGRRLLSRLEEAARARECVQSVLETHSFQAPGFYLKLGYQIVGTIEQYPPGEQKYTLRKRLV